MAFRIFCLTRPGHPGLPQPAAGSPHGLTTAGSPYKGSFINLTGIPDPRILRAGLIGFQGFPLPGFLGAQAWPPWESSTRDTGIPVAWDRA